MDELLQVLGGFAPALVYGSPFVMALLLGLGVPLIIVTTTSVTGGMTASMRLSIILCAMVVGSTLAVALSGRVLHSEVEYGLNPWLKYQDEPLQWGSRASQVCTAIVLCMSSAELFRWVTGKSTMEGRVQALWMPAMIYFVCAVVISGILGTFRNPRINDIYGPVVLTALALLASGVDTAMWKRVRLALLLPSAGSLLAAAIVPKLALLPEYVSLFPGVHVRLYGLTDHANSLGIVAAAALLLELCPVVRPRPSLIFLACHLAVLLLAQSKTAWVAALLCAMFVRWSWIRSKVFRGDAWRAAMMLAIVVSVVIALAAVAVGLGSRSARLLNALTESGVYTLTGRTEIWRVTLEEFFKSPVVGYGPSLWDLQFRYERGMLAAGQAHNQFIQILGQAGLLGLGAMLSYIAMLLYMCKKGWEGTQGLAFVLVLLVLVRCFSESPLRMGAVMGWDNWLHLTAFVAAASGVRLLKPAAAVRQHARRGLNFGS